MRDPKNAPTVGELLESDAFAEALAQPALRERLAVAGFYPVPPMDGPAIAENTRLAIDYCMTHPKWRLSVQTHKGLGIR